MTDQVVVSPTPGVLKVSIQQVLVESGGEAPTLIQVPLSGDQDQPAELVSPPLLFFSPDGSQYTLPPGLSLDGLEQDDAVRVAALVKGHWMSGVGA